MCGRRLGPHLGSRSLTRVVGLLALLTLVPSAAAQYEVRTAPGASALFFSLRMPAGAKAAVQLAPRGLAWGLKPQVSDVRCDGRRLPKAETGSWLAPPDCALVTWRVLPDRVSRLGADASRQRTLRVGRRPWLLLAEPTSLLRPIGDMQAGAISAAPASLPLAGATPLAGGGFRLPPASGAPEFYVLGHVQQTRRPLGQLQVSYVADDAESVGRLGLQARHASALNYLLALVPLPQPLADADRSLLVVWLGVAESAGQAGGAAGSRSFVANYVVGSPAQAQRHAARTLLIMAHEQFHQLVDMVQGSLPAPPATALWINESLAHYYGLKAMKAVDSSAAAQALWKQFIDEKRPVEFGLLELERRHAAGDPDAYDAFYTQGATFWHALDAAIAGAGHGRHGLDDYLGELLRMPVGVDGALPASLVERLRAVAGEEVDAVLAKYVGR